MRVCFDTNVVLDILTASNWLLDSFSAYDVAALMGAKPYIPASAVTDIVYIAHRRGLSKSEVLQLLPGLFEQYEIMDVTAGNCRNALQNGMEDYKDALVAESCRSNGINLIVTRNVKDFAQSPVPAISPADFVRIYKPAGYEYEELPF